MSLTPSRHLPDRPSLEQLRKQAREHLDTLRAANPAVKLAAAQHALAREYGFEKRNAFEQPVLEGLLRQGLERFDTVRALFGAELAGFSQSPGSVRAEIRLDGTERPLTVEARYMVA